MSTSTTLETPSQTDTAEPQENGGEAAAAADQPAAPPTPPARRTPLVSRAQVQAVAVRLARLIRFATVVAVCLIALGIVFQVLSANVHKWLVSDVQSAGRWLAGPFLDTFMVHAAKVRLALNWGIALLVYAILGPMLAKLVQALPERIGR